MDFDELDDIDKSVDLFLQNLERMKHETSKEAETKTKEVVSLDTLISTHTDKNILTQGEGNLPAPIQAQTPQQLQKRKTYYIINNQGLWEEIDAQTGTTVSIQRKMTNAERVKIKSPHHYLEIQHPEDPNKTILVDRRIDQSELKHWKPQNKGMPYSEIIADIILDEVLNGSSLNKISQRPDMPTYSIIRRWRNEHPEFEEAYQMAVKMRAEKLIDEALDIARQTEDPDNIVGTSKLIIDQLKYVAQQEDPKKYSQKASVSDNNGNNVVFNIISGIPDSSYTEKIANRTLDDQGKVVELSEPNKQISPANEPTQNE